MGHLKETHYTQKGNESGGGVLTSSISEIEERYPPKKTKTASAQVNDVLIGASHSG